MEFGPSDGTLALFGLGLMALGGWKLLDGSGDSVVMPGVGVVFGLVLLILAMRPEGTHPNGRPAAGWRPDPTGRADFRFWDGEHWTDHVHIDGEVTADPMD